MAGASEAMDTEWLRGSGSRASAKALKDAIGKCEHAGVAPRRLSEPDRLRKRSGR